MGKSRKRKGEAGRKAAAKAEPPVSRRRWLVMGLGAVAALGIGAKALIGRSREAAAPASRVAESGSSYRARETRPVLSATMFSGVAAQTYRLAAKVPRVLDQLYCYCRCQENHGHKSLLTCFATRHGAG